MTPYILAYSIALSNLINSPVIHESVDMIETNHLHDSKGGWCFDQVIFWEWDNEQSEYRVRAWTLPEDNARPMKIGSVYSFRYFDREQQVRREIVSKHFLESWSKTDREKQDRKRLKELERTALIRARN